MSGYSSEPEQESATTPHLNHLKELRAGPAGRSEIRILYIHMKVGDPAINGRRVTHPVVVHRIHRSGPALMTGPQLRKHQPAHIGISV
jgi:hypothetical protein